jgi:ribosome biogenesis GTPase
MKQKKLSKQQQRRIAQALEKRIERDQDCHQMGTVVANYGSIILIEDTALALQSCQARKHLGALVVGDQVKWQQNDSTALMIDGRLPRENCLLQPGYRDKIKAMAANLSFLIIVLAAEPVFDRLFLDRFLVAASVSKIQPMIVFNKCDLVKSKQFLEVLSFYQQLGYPVVAVSAHTGEGLDEMLSHIQQGRVILVGQSGVGKSSLTSALIPDLVLQCKQLTPAGLGSHTTSFTRGYRLNPEIMLIDSPGVRDFKLWPMSLMALESAFVDFKPFCRQCRFRNCTHRHEPGCRLVDAMENGALQSFRLDSFRSIYEKHVIKTA